MSPPETIAIARLRLQLYHRLNGRERRAFDLECAVLALPHFESFAPGDPRPRQALEVCRAYLAGQADDDALDEAHRAAWEAMHVNEDELVGIMAHRAAYAAATAALTYHPNAASSDFVPSAGDQLTEIAYILAIGPERDGDRGDVARLAELRRQVARLEHVLALRAGQN